MEQYWMWLCSVPELYCRQIMLLVTYFGDPRAVYEAPEKEFEIWREKKVKWVDQFLTFRKNYSVEEICHRTWEKGIRFISREQAEFPGRLKELNDCPAGLFYRGSLPKQDIFTAAIVGARQCSTYGKAMAREIAETLTLAGTQVISGMALGIDGCAQRAALEAGGESYGILGCGADICYPRENWNLYMKLLEKGGIITEYPPGTQPRQFHFPMRNRIISGLSDVVIVVEAREKSGSLITADLALEQGKDVYAVPGRNGDILSVGCNRLIEQGAGLVLSAEGLLERLDLTFDKKKIPEKKQLGLASEEKWVYSNLDLLPKGLEEIAQATDLPVARLGSVLVQLELMGLAAEVSKNYYVKLK